MVRQIVSLWALVGLGLTSGCDFIDKLAGDAKEEQAQKQTGADAALSGKLAEYVFCINRTSASVGRAHGHYFGWIEDPKAGPSGNERNVRGTSQIDDAGDCKGRIEKAAKMEPALDDLEKAAADFAKALEELAPLNAAAYEYYQRGGYEHDGFEKGKELHGELAPAFEAFLEADEKFREAFREQKVELDERELARLKRLGEELAYRHIKLMIEARKLVQIADVAEVRELDERAFEKQLDESKNALDEVEGYASKHPKDEKRVSMFDSFVRAAKEFVAAAEALHRRKRDGTEWSPSELMTMRDAPQDVTGSPAQVREKFNEVVQRSNALQWR